MKYIVSKIREHAVYLSVILTLCGIILLTTFSIWYPHGYIVFSDLDFGLDDSIYLKRIFGLFNSQFSSTNFFNLSRLAFTASFFGISQFFSSNFYPHFLPRAIMVLLLLISAIGMFRLCESIIHSHFGKFVSQSHYWGLIIPSLFYALNPWVIIRLQHIFLVVGYAFYPIIIRYFIQLFDSRAPTEEDSIHSEANSRVRKYKKYPQYKYELKISLKIAFFVGLGSAAIHYFFYYIITFLGIGIAFVVKKNIADRRITLETLTTAFRKLSILGITILLFCSYWLVPYSITSIFINIEPLNVNVTDTLSMFSRYSDIQHVLYLVSYWWPMFDTNKLLDTPFWIGGGVFLGIIVYTVFYRYGWHFYVRLFTWAAVISAIIALGVNTSLISGLNVYIVTKIPLIGQIFRDPNKLIGPMALFFAVLIGFGVDKLTYFLKSSGYSNVWRFSFIIALLICMYMYYRPYNIVFIQNYYAGQEVPKAYTNVQNNYLPDGKILWVPDMENMSISNGLSSYKWNGTLGNNLIKTSGDFHTYSSKKSTIFQNEGNSGIVSYFHSYVQNLLDIGGAQHLGSMISWAGFNELGYHQDVFGQENRQAYNLKILESQNDLNIHYQDDIFKLYTPPAPQAELSATSRVVYQTKGLNSLMGLLDYKSQLQLRPQETSLFWGPQRIQNVSLRPNDIIVGDNFAEMAFPLLDKHYYSFPYQAINTGNPYIDWAKTLIKTPDWNWILKSNNIRSSVWNYDFGEGIVYTYTSQRLPNDPYKVSGNEGVPFVSMKDVIDGFFTPDNPNIFQLTYVPNSSHENAVLSGSVTKGISGANLWQTAKSKLIQLDPKTHFINMSAIVSGINSGKLHFKIKFFNAEMKEIGVSYVSKDNDQSEFTKSLLTSDATVPENSRFMRIDINSTDDNTKNMYFTIYDFSIADITQLAKPNLINLPINDKKLQSYHTFIRIFQSEVGGDLSISGIDRTLKISAHGTPNQFVWLDSGSFQLNGNLLVKAEGGLNIVNSVVTIPDAEYDGLIKDLRNQLKGQQSDISLIDNDYAIQTAVDFKPLKDIRTFPNTLAGSLTPISEGILSKKIDILHDGIYQFNLNGWIPKDGTVEVTLQSSDGTSIVLNRDKTPATILDRNMKGMYNQIKYEDKKYFLTLHLHEKEGWDVNQYSYKETFIKQGSYTLTLSAKSNEPNKSHITDLHLLNFNEIHIPETIIETEAELLTYVLMSREKLSIKESEKNDTRVSFTNNTNSSPQWIILSLNPIPVKKGDLIFYKANLETENVKNVHSKMFFMDEKSNLIQTEFARTSVDSENDFYLMTRAPADGFIQPCFLYNGTKNGEGKVTLTQSSLYNVDKLIKLESTALLPKDIKQSEPGAKITGSPSHFQTENSRFVVYNEAFHPIWTMNGQSPLAVNLLHNAYPIDEGKVKGSISLHPLLNGIYYVCLIIAIVTHIAAAYLFIFSNRRKRI